MDISEQKLDTLVLFFSSQTWSLDSAYLYLSDSFFASGIEFFLRLKGQSHEIKV